MDLDADGLDAEACVELIEELVGLEGEAVFVHKVEAVGMASGGSSQVFRWKDRYFRQFDSDPLAGPFDSLDAALDDHCTHVSYLTERVDCTEWSVQELLQRLVVWPEGDPSDPQRSTRELSINGAPFMLKIGEALVPKLRAVP